MWLLLVNVKHDTRIQKSELVGSFQKLFRNAWCTAHSTPRIELWSACKAALAAADAEMFCTTALAFYEWDMSAR